MIQGWKSNVVRNFDSSAESYALYSGVQERVAWHLCSLLPHLSKPDILEIGCGTGVFTAPLLERYPDGDFMITDASPRMLRAAIKNFRDSPRYIQWMDMDGETPSTNKKFDLIVSNMAVQWFEDIEKSLFKLSQCLKEKGSLYFSMPGPRNFPEWDETLRRINCTSGRVNWKQPPGVFKEEEFTVHYKDTREFFRGLKRTGSYTPKAGYRSLYAPQMRRALKLCDEKYNGRMTWHILYGRLEVDKETNIYDWLASQA